MASNKTYPVVIPAQRVKKRKNKAGNYYWLVSIPNSTKEIYIPFAWLKQSSNGKYYKGSFERNSSLIGRQRNSIKMSGNDLEGVFPTKSGAGV